MSKCYTNNYMYNLNHVAILWYINQQDVMVSIAIQIALQYQAKTQYLQNTTHSGYFH